MAEAKRKKTQMNITVNPEIADQIQKIAESNDTTRSTEAEFALAYWLGARNRDNEIKIHDYEILLRECKNRVQSLENQLQDEKNILYKLIGKYPFLADDLRENK